MSVPWNRITPDDFEKLALEYAQFEFPQHNWIPTPRSGDGNRDAEATTREWVFDRLLEYQHWLEAKYHHKSGAPKRSQLDPTLVSGLIDPSVRAILFVTNGRISESYMARAERAFNRPPDRFVVFKEERDIAHWLSNHEIVSIRYFGTKINKATVTPTASLEISSVSILNASDYRRAFYRPLSHLITGGDYLLHLVVRSLQTQECEVRFSELSPFIIHSSQKGQQIQISSGISSHCIRVITNQIGTFTYPKLILEGAEFSATRSLSKLLTVRAGADLEMVFNEQVKIANDINQVMRNLYKGSNAICYVSGTGGVGKTHILDSIETNLDLNSDFLRIAFSGQPGEDARLLCELLLFLHFGLPGLELKTIDQSLIASTRQVRFFGPSLLGQLERATNDTSEARALIRDLTGNRDVRATDASLVDPLPASTPVVVVADDIHKLRGSEAEFMARILKDHFNGAHFSLFLLSARADEFQSPELESVINEIAIYTTELCPPTVEEATQSIERLLGRPSPKSFSVALESLQYTTLNIVNLLANLNSNKQKLDEPGLVKMLDQWMKTANIGKDKVILERIAKSRDLFPLLDIVHAVKVGVPIDSLISEFGSRAVDSASNLNLLKLNTDKFVIPFHDLTYDTYLELRGSCHTYEAGNFLANGLEQGTLTADRTLPALLRCGPSFEDRYLEIALAYRDSFINLGRFGPALDIAKSIVMILERRNISTHPERHLADAWFVYADCLDHCDIGDKTRYYFNKARGNLAAKWTEPIGNGVYFEAEAELFNLSFWDLEMNRLPKLEGFVDNLNKALADEPQVRYDRRFVRAYLTALNRLMTFSLLADRPAEKLLEQNLRSAEEFGMQNYKGFALIDYAKGTFHMDLDEAIRHLLLGNKLIADCGTEKRRELTSATELAFLECRAGFGSISRVIDAGRNLLEEGLWPEYLNSSLKLVALLISRGDKEGAEAQLAEFYRRRPALEQESRRAVLLANIESAVAFLNKDYQAAWEWASEHLRLVGNLGPSYRAVANWNKSVCKNVSQGLENIGWYRHNVKNEKGQFLLEPRIW